MITRHRNKAIIGVVSWFVLFAAFMVIFFTNWPKEWESGFIRENGPAAMIWGTVLAQYFFFFWGGLHLAKAKGYPYAVLFLGLFPCLQILVLTVFLVLPDKNAQQLNRSRKERTHRSHESEIGRIVRYRRNALTGNSLGLFGIFMGVVSVLFPSGLSADPQTETVIGIFIFLCGYASVITGCWWFAKAKGWPDGIVFIGLLPLAVVGVLALVSMPAMLLLFAATPALVPVSMVMMPLILFIIVIVLPDKSGITQRRRRDHR